ncbi:MAG: hypothetical protein HFI64_15640 [Lachnospiraceae bacterium]|nr:hypothetical protein [Lachnospiraceae bacterium]
MCINFQVMAWTLPTEKGFYYMRDLMHANPLEVGLDKGIGYIYAKAGTVSEGTW